jgi:hypothetical protein
LESTFPWQQPEILQHSQRLLSSFYHWTGRSLLDPEGTPAETARKLFEAPFVVVSHGTQSDPVLNYGNREALELWEMDWQQFTQTPSRQTAELIEQQERARLLEQARTKGYIDDYQGIRISSSGRRFWIQDVVIWDVLDEQQVCCGQAATFSRWKFIA